MFSDTDNHVAGLLRERGHRVTSQRLVVNRVLQREGGHLSAELVRDLVANELPGISVPTVYATLDLLVELGLARRLTTGAGPMLFDARTDPHHHAMCRVCGRVEDLDAQVSTRAVTDAAQTQGFAAEAVDVVVHGLCPDCRG